MTSVATMNGSNSSTTNGGGGGGIGSLLESRNNAQTTSSKNDALALRRALRLIHCMQKERGASCAYFSSSVMGGANVSNMDAARRDTDVAMRLFDSFSEDKVPFWTTLTKIRNLIDTPSSSSQSNKRNGLGFHRILVMFNSLISTFVHDYILPQVPSSNDSLQNRKRKQHRRMRSLERHFAPLGVSPPAFALAAAAAPPPPPPPNGPHLKRSDSSPCLFQISTSPKFSRASSPRVTFSFEDDEEEEENAPPPQSRKDSLLLLLGSFVRLKESTGVERATLSSLLALGRTMERDLLQPMVNDLVLEVENQRLIVQELQSLPTEEWLLPIMALVQAGVEYGPEMASLQQSILKDFDLQNGFQIHLSTEQFWELITVYIDRLHSLELLIMEEIECCLYQDGTCGGTHPSNVTSENKAGHESDANDLAALLVSKLGLDSSSSETAFEELKSVSPEQLKSTLLAMLSPDASSPEPPISPEASSTLKGESIALVADNAVVDVEFHKEWEINLYELKFKKRIGQGAAGTTYLANWSGQTVAVKVASINEMGLSGWRSEVQSLQRLHHPNIIRLLGSVCNESPLTYCLVLEYCNAGDLNEALRQSTPPDFFSTVAFGLSNGMTYLHSRGVIHRDIKPANVLLHGNVASGNFIVKVNDFGVATTTSMDGNERTAETGTYRWMAPEVIRHESYSNLADVYSFALVLWQLLTRENPFATFSQIEAAGMVALEQARPPFPSGTPNAIIKLIRTCWSENPDARLPFEKIRTSLDEIAKTLSEQEEEWLNEPRGHRVYKKEKTPTEKMPPRAVPPAQVKTEKRKSFRTIFTKTKK